MDRYDEFFDSQVGRGAGVGRIYIGAPYQRGHGGIGSFLAGALRRVLPLLSRGAKAVGKEALSAGMNIVSDLANRTPLKESFRNRVRESGENLKRKAEEKIDRLMEGSGYKFKRSIGELQSLDSFASSSSGRKRKSKKKKKKQGRRKRGAIKGKGKKTVIKKRKRSVVSKKKKKKTKGKRTLKDIFDQ